MSLPAFAGPGYRVEIIAQREGQRVDGAEACFFHAGDGTGPFESFLEGREVRCLPADQVLELPAGRWWFYVRHAEQNLISSTPSRITIREVPPSAEPFKRMEVELRPAASLDISRVAASLGTDERLAVYISNEGTDSLPMLIPIARDETTAMIPARMPVVLLLLRNSLVVNMSEPFSLEKGNQRVAPPFQPLAADTSNVIAWIEFPDEERRPADYWRALPAPNVTLEGGGKSLVPAIAPRAGFGIDGALLFFRNVPFAEYTLKLRGSLWAAGDLAVEAKKPGLTIPRVGLMTRPAASLTADWSVGGTQPDTPSGDCAPASETPSSAKSKNAAARLFVCDGLQPSTPPGSVDHSRCKPYANPESIDGRARRTAFQGVKPGTYLLSIYEPGFPPGNAVVTLPTGQETHSSVSFQAFHVLGKITLDDKPLKARLEFRNGMAFSDDDGHYHGALPLPPKDLTIRVIRCSDGELMQVHKPAHPLETNVPYDIRIETNEVRIAVIDAETHRGVPHASILVTALMADGSSDLLSNDTFTDADGNSSYHNVPPDQKVVICASAAHYKRTCTEGIALVDTRDRSVRIELPRALHAGRLVTGHQFAWGQVYFVGPDRAVREKVSVGADGTFSYHFDHISPEYVVVASDLPLFAQPLPDATPEELDIPIPNLPTRSFDVSISAATATKDAWIGLFIAGRYIPWAAFNMHEGARGLQSMILGGGPLRVPDVFDAGPIQVALGASRDEQDPDPESRFILPRAASWNGPIKSVDATNHVVF